MGPLFALLRLASSGTGAPASIVTAPTARATFPVVDPCRAVAATFVLSLTFSFAACFGAPTRNVTTTGTHSSSGTGSGGAAASASTGTAVSGTGASGTGGTGMGGGGSGGAGPSGSTGTGVPSDAGYLDVSPDAIGMGGLPQGATCGGSAAAGDGGVKCGAGLACCYPCKNTMCNSVCRVVCDPSMKGCINGCVLMP